jgi:hypothetical protein
MIRFALSNEDSFSVIERVLIVSWLMTDLGWMTTNILIGRLYMCVCILCAIGYQYVSDSETYS